MIDSEFIIKYTNALYSTRTESAPRYDEFRDMFSSGQIKSKEWILNELFNLGKRISGRSILVAGAWYGTLGMMLKKEYPDAKITMLDIDPRCKEFVQNMIYNMSDINYITIDMFNYVYTEDIIFNTSCEHIEDLPKWISLIPSKRIVVLQSNDRKYDDHINCPDNLEHFIEQANLSKVLYSGKLELPEYNRFMIIGLT